MKLESKYFDSIRVKAKDEPVQPTQSRGCQWKGCAAAGVHRAPRNRGREGDYVYFCLDHVRQFNAGYNYYEGMSNSEVETYQKDATTGHRPTWKLGENSGGTARDAPPVTGRYARFARKAAADPHEFLENEDGSPAAGEGTRQRALRPLERRAFDTMRLPETATRSDIKSRFKELVKRHHPDANGGDRASEDKLREIIQAYNYLKQAGLV